MNTKIISKDIIKPYHPTPKNLRLLQASLFDHVNSPTLMPLIFFFSYPKTPTTTNITPTNKTLIKLKESLPITLSLFYPLAGRVRDVDHIDCNDEGVPYIETEVDQPLENIIHKVDVCHLDKLLPSYGHNKQGFTKLLLAIQINVFMCGGLAISVKMSHAISDAFSSFMFVNTWASIASSNKQHKITRFSPCFEISKAFPPLLSSNTKKYHIHSDDEFAIDNNISAISENSEGEEKDRPITKWFMFEEAKLDALRKKLYKNTNYKLPSLSMVLSSFIWAKFKKFTTHNIPHHVFHAVNIRNRVSPPNEYHHQHHTEHISLIKDMINVWKEKKDDKPFSYQRRLRPVNQPDEQSYYFGNMVVNAISDQLSDKSNKESLRMLEFLDAMKKSIARILKNDTFIRKMQDGREDLSYMTNHFERENKGEIVSLAFSSVSSLPVYEADFGWGKPTWVTCATLLFSNLVIMIPTCPSNKDIVAYISLNAKDMGKLENDLEFISLVSKAPHLRCKI
ncbi:unnamed protein product [Amaranthus hypochondriacus]